ncbi:glycosyltransferase [Sporolactobacillus sp. Y61]|uniref:Glycosyltransferase n=1 Tax=Sporolactobacillus sp. Y61 TaxID=3160863 RepID=A0AAU8II77_9BACL
MNILFLNNLLPYPLDNGGKINTYNTIKALSKNNNVDLLSFINDESERVNIKRLNTLCDRIQVVKKTVIRGTSTSTFVKDYIMSFFTPLPYVINKFYSKEMEKLIIQYQGERNYDLIYVNHLSMMVYNKSFYAKVLLHEQNVESKIFGRFIRETKNPVKKILGYNEYLKLKKFEIKMLNKSDCVIALSSIDKNEFQQMLNDKADKIHVIAIHIDADLLAFDHHSDQKINLLFMGTMSWYPNQDGIIWFLKNCFPQLDPQKFNLFVCGSNPPEEVLEYETEKNITVTGYVDDIDDYMKYCDIGIVPLFIGSGQRVKIIESFAKGLPVVSTSIGAEGIISEQNNILIADSSEKFIQCIKMLAADSAFREKIKINARKIYVKNYSTNSLIGKLDKIISEI